MKFLQRILEAGQPLCMSAARATACINAAKNLSITDTVGLLFNQPPKPYVAGRVGVVPLMGAIGKGLSAFDRMTGGADIDQFRSDLASMAANPKAEIVLVHINSPGGSVIGLQEAADELLAITKPTVSYASELECSAGYMIGSQADRAIVAPSAFVGCVGTYQVHYNYDTTRDGYTVEMFKSGDLKGAGYPGLPLSQAQKDHYQSIVDTLGGQFRQTVLRTRTGVSMADMQGQEFLGSVAAEKGMFTGTAPSLEALLAELNS